MVDGQKILCCRISWMPEYKSIDEKPFSHHRYIIEKNTPYEALNFLANEDGLYRGYVPLRGDAVDEFGKINITRLGAAPKDNRIEGIIVIFCAPHEQERGLRIVGFYQNATVLKQPEVKKHAGHVRVTRILSKDAVLIPEAERVFTIPGRHDGGFGQSNLWYGLDQNQPLREAVQRYVANTDDLPPEQPSVVEYRRRLWHKRWEGRGSVRGFIHQKGFKCEACDYSITPDDQQIWGSGFELHHLEPWSTMLDGEQRELKAGDFAVLCAICHRAIHRTDHVSNIEEFRRHTILGRNNYL